LGSDSSSPLHIVHPACHCSWTRGQVWGERVCLCASVSLLHWTGLCTPCWQSNCHAKSYLWRC